MCLWLCLFKRVDDLPKIMKSEWLCWPLVCALLGQSSSFRDSEYLGDSSSRLLSVTILIIPGLVEEQAAKDDIVTPILLE